MKIGIISDTHGDLFGWQKAIELLADCNYIIHCGDILNPGPFNPLPEGFNPLGLAEELNKSDIPILFVRGNCDSEVDTLAIKLPIQSPYLIFNWEELNLIAQHGHQEEAEDYYKTASTYKVKIAISGHTHIYDLQKKDGLLILNPGSPSIPKGSEIPTIALLDDKKVKVIDISSGKTLKENTW